MANKEKRKKWIKKRMKQQERDAEKRRLDQSWRNIFVKSGILNPKETEG
ncbi:hypothetical protein JOC94_004191 [Bacillus thermophilus]|uniref:DUF3983 domain-containing protein n=1 Tax=Siminovitchia thermophila TaxID=1245522 RepID=A0ABS2RF01_9BACI|nr:hypothetical protein [Siminovitchia thermophila]